VGVVLRSLTTRQPRKVESQRWREGEYSLAAKVQEEKSKDGNTKQKEGVRFQQSKASLAYD